MIRSIRWTLLFWYTAILVVVIGSTGGVLFSLQQNALVEEVAAEIQAHADVLAGSVEWDHEDGLELDVTDEYLAQFDGADRDDIYFAAWDKHGRILWKSKYAPNFDRERDGKLERTVTRSDGIRMLVGRGMHDVRRKLRKFRGKLVAAGAGGLILAFFGGWFLVGRVLRPIRRMSAAASNISANNLSERIDVGNTETELGHLASTLNDTFSRIEKAFDQHTRFTADASHELRTPLSVVTSNIEVALKRERSPEEYRETLETCLRASQRMKSVVEGLLMLARSDASEILLRKEEVDLKSLVADAAQMLKPLADQRKVEIHVSAESTRGTVDAERLREVLDNLLTNSIRYNRENGRVDVSLRRDGDAVLLIVRDTGMGIPEDKLPHIFDRFFRVDKARAREHGGSGLGLSIAKLIVDAHGGTIGAESTEGEGTTFTVRLPAGIPVN